jgi:predicted transcriptional regulator
MLTYNKKMIMDKTTLERLYLNQNLSMMQISQVFHCSQHKIQYWMSKYQIERRTISDAIYKRSNPNGDPFKVRQVESLEDAFLLGMGIGLYWGEGHKRSKHSVRFANTDPQMIKTFIKFLEHICGIDTSKLRYSLQIFSDINSAEALEYWVKELEEDPSKFGKVTVTRSGSIGTYKRKNYTGVLIVNFHNYKLRDIIVGLCREGALFMPR